MDSPAKIQPEDEGGLLPDYRQRPSKFFKFGKVFMTLWAEPFLDSGANVQVTNQELSTTAWRGVTSGRQGAAKSGVAKSEHAIIYTGRSAPKPLDQEVSVDEEQSILPQPIKILKDGFAKVLRLKEDSPTPCSTMPFARDPHFVDRKELARLKTMLSPPGGRAALTGLGGVGCQSPRTWVFWIHASDPARFDQSVRDVADLLGLAGRKDPKADILQLLRNWLRKEEQWGPDFVDVNPMSEEEAESMLEKKVGRADLHHRELVRALECMPLAITQAAAYIRERGPRCSAQEYRETMERSRISFEHILKVKPSAANLLSLMSFCDRLAIPQNLLRTESEQGAQDEQNETFNAFDDDIIALRNFSFISDTTDRQTWEMHRLVQDATQMWLRDSRKLDETHNQFIERLDLTFPTGDFENWSACRSLFPHAKASLGQKTSRKERAN
ncbi:hypothetical protein MRB53_041949 [Persea americana]|nr:hypothetical protein MRB53_041949 [Persea americana]